MQEQDLITWLKDYSSKEDSLEDVMSYVVTTSKFGERRVNVPRGTPGSFTSLTSKPPKIYVKPENMETLDFLEWLNTASANDLESFANKEI